MKWQAINDARIAMRSASMEPNLNRIFRALGDPLRRTMIQRLVSGPLSVTELSCDLAISLTAVLQHLDMLQNAGLVTSRKIGRVRICQLLPQALSPATGWIGTVERRAA
jgi:DNA-binding transcriptional ArsR family regulator